MGTLTLRTTGADMTSGEAWLEYGDLGDVMTSQDWLMVVVVIVGMYLYYRWAMNQPDRY